VNGYSAPAILLLKELHPTCGVTPDTLLTGQPDNFEPGPNPTARQRGDETDQN
jgi:hypothetical protein